MRLPHARITILALCGLAPSRPTASTARVHGVADASGNANDGATTASRTQDGRFGRALNLDGPTAAANIPDDASLRPLRTVTLEARFDPTRRAARGPSW